MNLVNNTTLAAGLTVSEISPDQPRIGMLVAKATYKFDADGKTTSETEAPFPIFDRDEETELGLLPRDDFPRLDSCFEVILLGSACTAPGKPATQMVVSLTVGRERRSLTVQGDRRWEKTALGIRVSEPALFARMPLVWQRAFGGSAEVLIDVESPVTIAEPVNRLGRGFDPGPGARHMCKVLNAPVGFPVYDETRLLPNLEDPQAVITKWDDAPRPLCWATVPLDAGLHAQRCIEITEDPDAGPTPVINDKMLHRAHPDWVIDLPPPDSSVVLEGLAVQPSVRFPLPPLRVLADFVAGERTGSRELVPHMLVLLPDEGRFYIVYRLIFNYQFEPEVERSFRLRTDTGWYQPE